MKQKLVRLVQDKHGNLAVMQWPNIPLWGWIICTLLLRFIKTGHAHNGFSFMGSAFLFTWAYLEISGGKSPFRRVLGSLVMFYLVLSHFK